MTTSLVACECKCLIETRFLILLTQELPYGGKLSARKNAKPCEGVNFALLEQTVIQKGEGKLLMAALTGVHATKKSLFNTRLPSSGQTLTHKAATVQFVSEVAPTMGLKCSPRGDTINESKKRMTREPMSTGRRGT